MANKRIKVAFGPGSKDHFEFSHRPPPAAAPTARASHAPARSPRAVRRAWIQTGIARGLLLVLIVVGGVGAVLWLRDVATAVGVHWLGG